MTEHTKEPWLVYEEDVAGDTEIYIQADADAVPAIAEIMTHGLADFDKSYDIDEQAGRANARRIVACVNACKRFTIEVLEAAASCGGITAEPTAELLMAEQKSDAAFNQLHRIREAIAANPEESTADEVRRVVQQRDNLLLALKSLLYASHHCSEMDWVGEDDPWFNATFLVQEIETTK